MAKIIIRRVNGNFDLAEFHSNACPRYGESYMHRDDSVWAVSHVIHRGPVQATGEDPVCMVYVSPIPDTGQPMDLRPEGSRPVDALEAALDVGGGDA